MVMVKGQIKRNTVIKTLNPGNHSNKSMYLKISSIFAFKRLRYLENYSGRGITRGRGEAPTPCLLNKKRQ